MGRSAYSRKSEYWTCFIFFGEVFGFDWIGKAVEEILKDLSREKKSALWITKDEEMAGTTPTPMASFDFFERTEELLEVREKLVRKCSSREFRKALLKHLLAKIEAEA